MNIKYLAQFKYGSPAICEVEVLKETEKTITVRQVKGLIGWIYIHDRMNKKNLDIFDTKNDAIKWLTGKASNQISMLKKEIERAEEIVRKLGEI